MDETFKQPNVLPESILSSVYLIDMMSFVQKFQHLGAKSFGQLLSRYIAKGPVKLIKRVKVAHSFLQSVSDQFHVIILSLSM